MRTDPTKDIEQYRVSTGPIASTKEDGRNGAFLIWGPRGIQKLKVVASDGSNWKECGLGGEAWEHVSVSSENRIPHWVEMDFVKRIFWHDDETVIQMHVPRSEHINHHSYCLHLWKPPYELPLPPSETVGPKGKEKA